MRRFLLQAMALTAFSFPAFGAHAHDSNAAGDDPEICTHPVRTICHDCEAQKARRLEMQKNWKAAALKKTEELLATEGDFSKYLKIISENPQQLELDNPKDLNRFKYTLGVYQANLRQAMGLTDKRLAHYLAAARKSVIDAVRSNESLSAEVKNKMEQKIADTRSAAFEYGIKGSIEFQGQTAIQFFSGYVKMCGWDGFGGTALNRSVDLDVTVLDHATKQTVDKTITAQVLFVCPTIFASSIVEDSDVLAPSATLTHELGHSVDDKYFSRSYDSLRACWKTHAPKSTYWQKDARNNPIPINGLEREMLADFWSAEGLAKWIQSAKTQEERVRLIKQATQLRCNMVATAQHPSGEFRVEFIFRNASLRKVLGCSAPTADAPVCTIAGTVPAL